jgi:hypothetical protein
MAFPAPIYTTRGEQRAAAQMVGLADQRFALVRLDPPYHYRRPAARRGLSMLELTLSLPILLMVMALMVNVGNVAAWKVRDLSLARLAVWQTRWPRTGGTDPRPDYWPDTGTSGAAGTPKLELNPPWDDRPMALLPPDAAIVGGTTVNDVLDPPLGTREGTADLTRRFPLLTKFKPNTVHGQTGLLDDKWQYQRMGLGSNFARRIPVLYALTQAPQDLVNAYISAAVAVMQAHQHPSPLDPLDHDDDFIFYGQLFGWGGAHDFYPRLFEPNMAVAFQCEFCTLDQSMVDQRVQNLLDQINNLPKIMTQAFLGLYQRAQSQYQAMLNSQPPPTPAEMATLQAQIQQLQGKIDTLNQFQSQLNQQGP